MAALAGCEAPLHPELAAPQATRVTLEYWLADQNPDVRRAWGAVVAPALADRLPQLDVRPAWFAWEELYPAIAAAVPSGRLPDLMQLRAPDAVSYGGQGMLLPLDGQLAATGARGSFYPGTLGTGAWAGAIYGVPHLAAPRTRHWRADLLEAAGIPAVPSTWEETIEAVRRLTRLAGLDLERAGAEPPEVQEYLAAFAAASAEPVIVAGRAQVGGVAGREALRYLIERTGPARTRAGVLTLPRGALHPLADGRLASLYTDLAGSTGLLLRERPSLADRLVAGRPPVPGRQDFHPDSLRAGLPAMLAFANWTGIAAASAHPDPAWHALEVALAGAPLAALNRALFTIPPRAGGPRPDHLADGAGATALELLATYGVAPFKCPAHSAVLEHIRIAVQSSVAGGVEPSESLAIAAFDIDATLNAAGFAGDIVPDRDPRFY
ncbi:MAG: extracellular solute-binding protein [Actinobacteria bacterium]|nr:extracellular solute-binding protein [Actinomycetota bacterium]